MSACQHIQAFTNRGTNRGDSVDGIRKVPSPARARLSTECVPKIKPNQQVWIGRRVLPSPGVLGRHTGRT